MFDWKELLTFDLDPSSAESDRFFEHVESTLLGLDYNYVYVLRYPLWLYVI